MIKIQDARSGNLWSADEIIGMDYYHIFIDSEHISMTLVEQTKNKNKKRIVMAPADGYEFGDHFFVSKRKNKYYLEYVDGRGNVYARELTEEVVADYELKIRIEY